MAKLIIAGSREVPHEGVVADAFAESPFLVESIDQVVSGTARGIDRLGEAWAEGYGIPIHRMPADWQKFGRSAGYRRNEDMARHADALLAVWDGSSRGTKHMIDLGRKHGLTIYIHRMDGVSG